MHGFLTLYEVEDTCKVDLTALNSSLCIMHILQSIAHFQLITIFFAGKGYIFLLYFEVELLIECVYLTQN